jgi:hypothetical protein
MASPSTHGRNFFPRSFAGRAIGFAAVDHPLIQQSSSVLQGTDRDPASAMFRPVAVADEDADALALAPADADVAGGALLVLAATAVIA